MDDQPKMQVSFLTRKGGFHYFNYPFPLFFHFVMVFPRVSQLGKKIAKCQVTSSAAKFLISPLSYEYIKEWWGKDA